MFSQPFLEENDGRIKCKLLAKVFVMAGKEKMFFSPKAMTVQMMLTALYSI